MSSHTQDDGFHEIQLNGKQLVFLFMAATVVSVVIFLCGVLVGRGVRAERAAAGEITALNNVPMSDVVPPSAPPASEPTPAGTDPTKAAPPPAVEELSYFNRLETQEAPAEELKAAPEHTAPPPSPAEQSAVEARVTSLPGLPAAPKQIAAPAVSLGPPRPTDPTIAEPSGQGFALQIAALRERNEAEAIAKRLTAKGYGAYVLSPANGTPTVFRVRVGKFRTRREAENIASKLQKEEQFNPWITR